MAKKNEFQEAKTPKGKNPKRWPSYFKEFFMLFLAIILGFFVENQREAYVERQSAKVLAQSMLEDLERDKKDLEEAILFLEDKEQKIAQFIEMLRSPKSTWDTLAIYQSMTKVFSTFPFLPTDGTYTQMKSSGTLRYFDQRLVNKMNAYDNQLKKTLFRDSLVERGEWELVPLAGTLLNFEVTGEMRFGKTPTKEMYLKIKDQDTLDLFINKIMVVRTMSGRSLQEYKAQLTLANQLISSLESR
ncbi:hypothetical protein DFQ04_1658 [Algoriphagus boseongensis]|uniref:Uncharacterized protein n=1 Tax=Algoriphagus boseongensis TaxID=1442587 RepID=A0A4V3D248_9BACT|nr:hypothetical protein [Algoriphagus boseongensis]TDQ17010.1 hypothetical protein DFQ04_1658 [Algoriphagus boseongensis]